MDDLKSSVIQYCSEIGNNPLLVQGAGGNVSWKDGGTLWVKASGTWLSDAATANIFVPVDLDDLRKAIDIGNFSVKPKLMSDSGLKPSIETLLHALMPHPVVVHLHAIEVLAHLVRSNCEEELASLPGNRVPSVMVDYFKPGAELATAIKNSLNENRDAKVIFLKNHGIVIGGSDISEIKQTLNVVTDLLGTRTVKDNQPPPPPSSFDEHIPVDGYAPIDDKQLHQLAVDARLFTRLKEDWALYPDHVVFLGPHAQLYNSFDELNAALSAGSETSELVFVRGKGVFVTKSFSKAKTVQLRCYHDVLARQPQDAKLASISPDQVADLLTRDDEKYRMRFAK